MKSAADTNLSSHLPLICKLHYYEQCWGKLLALLPKKELITLLSYFLWKVMRYNTFALLFKYEQGLIVCF